MATPAVDVIPLLFLAPALRLSTHPSLCILIATKPGMPRGKGSVHLSPSPNVLAAGPSSHPTGLRGTGTSSYRPPQECDASVAGASPVPVLHPRLLCRRPLGRHPRGRSGATSHSRRQRRHGLCHRTDEHVSRIACTPDRFPDSNDGPEGQERDRRPD